MSPSRRRPRGSTGTLALDAVECAEHAHLVRVSSHGDADRVAFRHDLVRHTLLAGLSVQRRRRLHVRAADVLERMDAGDSAALAGHLLQAGTLVPAERTVAALHCAAADALASAAFGQAARLLGLGLDRCTDAGTRAGLLADLAMAERALGRPAGAITHWEAALAAYEERGDTERAADVCFELSRVLENVGRLADSATAALRGLTGLPEGPLARRVDLLAQLANSTSYAGAFDEAAAAVADAESIADRLAEPAARARVLTARALHEFTRASLPGCGAAAEAALDVVQQTDDAYGAGMASTLLQWALIHTGRTELARTHATRLGELTRRAGDVFNFHTARSAAVLDVLATGDLDVYTRRVAANLEHARVGGVRWLADAAAEAGQAAFWRGEVNAALRLFEEAVGREPPGAYRGRYQAPLLRVLAHLGEDALFRTRWGALADCNPTSLGGRFATLAAAEGLAVLGDRDAAAALAGRVAVALAGGLVLTFVDLRLVRTVAGLVAADPDEADAHFRAAVAQADALPHRIEAAEARRLWGESLLARGERARARELLAGAAERYRRLGMPRHRELSETRLAGA